ncbi:hypothetical protein [Pseudoalteromonas luteoviolacea]|uniref:Uncharacterized protein n=1 Tax=Pseudoalteromonas luteoviolacea H33 TaxID=1365251 RepID=A0A167AUT6_9GAMM|nr:hypothetical protein [Pseudoalteromonas luteoviolacea]KZN45829.1 hypothetical protein N476_25020 [Pseudoalteromonas luteoviolacea H33]KZN76948.1 hypothetical protein N477_13900 [Pseudoalteromonas luteoviolacea H33-S]
MNNKIRFLACLNAAVFCGFATASTTLSELMIDGNLAVFKTHAAKPDSSLSCVSADKKSHWAVDLTTHSGRATYSSLVTALNTGAQIEVTSTKGCIAGSGYEQAKSVLVKADGMSKGSTKTVRFAGLLKYGGEDRCETHYTTRGSRDMTWEDYAYVKDDIISKLAHGSKAYIPSGIQSIDSFYDPNTKKITRYVLLKDGSTSSYYDYRNRYCVYLSSSRMLHMTLCTEVTSKVCVY